MKILITGGAGFIGSHLVDKLVSEGHFVRVLDSFEPQVHQHKKPDYLNDKAEYIKGDIRDEKALRKALSEIDYIFNFAAKVGVGQSMYEIKDYVSSNSYGTAFLLDFIINNKLRPKKIIVASSMSIYGEGLYECPKCGLKTPYLRDEKQLKSRSWELKCGTCKGVLEKKPTPETKQLLSTSVYAISKKDQEELCLTVGQSYGIPTVALRFFNVYGPRQSLSNPYTGACAIFSSRISNDNQPLIYEDGMQTRDFVDVRDIVQACLIALKNDDANYKALNVGTGIPTEIINVARILSKLYEKKIKPLVVSKYRVGDIRHCYADISEIKKLGFKPAYDLEEGLKDLVSWAKQVKSSDKTDIADKKLDQFNLKI